MPVLEHAETIGEVVRGIDAQDRIQGGVGKRKSRGRVNLLEGDALGKPVSLRSSDRRRDPVAVDVDARDASDSKWP